MNSCPSISLTIPRPCNENWSQMAPEEQGRFCSQCQKCVVDFTNWSDAALYQFLSKKDGNICGRFSASQLERSITSERPIIRKNGFRFVLNAGLSLLMTSVPAYAHSQVKPSLEQMYPTKADAQELPGTDTSGTFYGTVSDKYGVPMPEVIITLVPSGAEKIQSMANSDGHFEFRNLPQGTYDVEISTVGYSTLRDTIYISDKGSMRSMYTLEADPRSLPKTMIMMGQVSVRPAYYQVPLRPAYYIDGRNNRETSIKRFLKGLFRKRN